jgi:hypothetical protein
VEPETAHSPAKHAVKAAEYVFTAFTPYTFPELRDAAGVIVGTVAPGDTRRFVQAPDDSWWAAAPGKGA